MSEQATWVPVPRARRARVNIKDVLINADRLINWYSQNRPNVTRITVSSADYQAMEKKAGTCGVRLTPGGLYYRDFLISQESA